MLLAICVVALGVRVATRWAGSRSTPSAATYYYHRGANLLADGEGFVHPYAYDKGVRIPGADHPPGYILVLAVPSLVGLDTILAHQLVGSLLGTGTVLLLGLAGRRIAGDRAGLVAAGVGALYPALWLNDASLMSESLALLCGTLVILAAYNAWDRPSGRWFALTGRPSASPPWPGPRRSCSSGCWPCRSPCGRPGWPAPGRGSGGSPWPPAPPPWWWRPGWGPTWSASRSRPRCPPRWGPRSRPPTATTPTTGRASARGRWRRPSSGTGTARCSTGRPPDNALDYVDDHRDRLPSVLVARLLRTFNLAHVSNQVNFDWFAEARPIESSRAAVGAFWVIGLAAIAGAVVLRRRGIPSFPLWSAVLNVAITVVVFYGSTRFRAPAEPAFVLGAAVAFDAAIRRLRHRAGGDRPPVRAEPVPAG